MCKLATERTAEGNTIAGDVPRAFLTSSWLIVGFTAASCAVRRVGAILDPTAEERRMVWKYPNCEHLKFQGYRKVDWLWYRDQLHQLPYPANVRVTIAALENLAGLNSAEYDEEARVCLMGLPAAFFFLTRYTLDSIEPDEDGRLNADMLQQALMQYSVFENYISVFHPGLIDTANWTLTDHDVTQLRRRVLQATRHIDKGTASEQQLRVYVYEEEQVPQITPLVQGTIYCSRGQWGMDVTIHDFFSTCPYRTDDPSEADFFFVPGYAICMLEGNIHDLDKIDQLYSSLVTSLPYFNASGGRDHIFVFGSGMAHSVFQSWRDYIPHSIVLTPETELFNDFAWIIEPPFQTWKDIAIPGALDLSEIISLLSFNKPLKERTYLGAFFGRVDITRGPHPWVGGVDTRKEIIELMQNGTGHDFAFGDNKTHDVMHSAYGSSRFCFVPRGKSGWSLRFFESLFAGCIPVVLSDKWEFPFEDFLDVTKFVIKWPSTQIGPQLIAYLRSLPDAIVQAYMDEAERVRCWYFYPPKKMDVRAHLRRHHGVCPESKGQDAFQGILRLLRARRRVSRTSARTFYFRESTGRVQRVNADLEKIS